jgi:sarcosine/dimethylglycine N-methyltransferase
MSDTNSAIIADYGEQGLEQRIMTRLASFGVDTDNLTQEILAEIDHVHGGGLANTKAHCALVEFRPGMRVLDIGCGIGGPARYVAATFGCAVVGIDLAQEYTDVATMLTERCGMQDSVSFECANALDLPFDDDGFDVAMSLNVTMNIEDRTGFYAEVARVLKQGGQLALSELGQGPGGEPYYPLPWARDPSYSFLITPDELKSGLEASGFRIAHWVDEAELRKKAGGRTADGTTLLPPGEGMKMVRGDDYPVRQANSGKGVMEERLTNIRLSAVYEGE